MTQEDMNKLWNLIAEGDFEARERLINQIDLKSQSGEELSLNAYIPVLIKDSDGAVKEVGVKEALQYLQSQENKDDNAIVTVQADHNKDVIQIRIDIAAKHPQGSACESTTFEFDYEYSDVYYTFGGRRIHGTLQGEVNGDNNKFRVKGAIVDLEDFDVANSGLIMDPKTYEISETWSFDTGKVVVEITIADDYIPTEGAMTFIGHGVTIRENGSDVDADFLIQRDGYLNSIRAKATKYADGKSDEFAEYIADGEAKIVNKQEENTTLKELIEEIGKAWETARKALAESTSDTERADGFQNCKEKMEEKLDASVKQINNAATIDSCQESVASMKDDKKGLSERLGKLQEEGDEKIKSNTGQLESLYESGLFEEDNSEEEPEGPAAA